MIRIIDDLQTTIQLDAPPHRIVSLVPSLTETLIELGAGDRVVGCTDWCVHPAEVTAGIAKVGGTKNVSVRTVLDLEPDLVIANKEENRERHVDALRERVPVFVTYPRTVDQALKTLADMGRIADNTDGTAEVERQSRAILAELAASNRRSLSAACMIWKDPWMVAGGDSYMSDLLDRCGFANEFAGSPARYPETTLEEIFGRDVEVILLPDEPYAFGSKDVVEVMKARPTGSRTREIILLDGSFLTWYGVRTKAALEFLRDLRAGIDDDG